MAEPFVDTLVIPSRLESIDGAREWSAGHARSAGFDQRAVYDLELALTEALSNVIRHGYAGNERRAVRLSLAIDSAKLSIRVQDSAPTFNREGHQPPDLDNPGPKGYGLYLIEELMDEVTRDHPLEGGTVLTLVKYRLESPDG